MNLFGRFFGLLGLVSVFVSGQNSECGPNSLCPKTNEDAVAQIRWELFFSSGKLFKVQNPVGSLKMTWSSFRRTEQKTVLTFGENHSFLEFGQPVRASFPLIMLLERAELEPSMLTCKASSKPLYRSCSPVVVDDRWVTSSQSCCHYGCLNY